MQSKNIRDIVKSRIDYYIGFDSDTIFDNSISDLLLRIFGGAIRDAISENEIHDIDIIVGSSSNQFLAHILNKNGYKLMESLIPKDLASVYHDIKIINEPHTYMKGDKIIQVIRPVPRHIQGDARKVTKEDYTYSFNSLIKEVDISCCGVSYDGRNVYENVKDAVLHCRNGVFIINDKNKMYSEKRIIHRTSKLEARGWVEIKNDISIRRDLVINDLLENDNLEIIKEW
jgi:hypothetical protein